MLKGTVEQTAAGWELRTGIVVIGPVPGLAETGHIGARRVLEKLGFWVDAPSVDLASRASHHEVVEAILYLFLRGVMKMRGSIFHDNDYWCAIDLQT